jgi:hypothetical protein
MYFIELKIKRGCQFLLPAIHIRASRYTHTLTDSVSDRKSVTFKLLTAAVFVPLCIVMLLAAGPLLIASDL